MSQAATPDGPGRGQDSGIDMERLSLALVGNGCDGQDAGAGPVAANASRLAELLAAAVDSLQSDGTARRWAILDRLAPGHYRATTGPGVSRRDVRGLVRSACGRRATCSGGRAGGGPRSRGPTWCAMPGDGGEPELVLACWSPSGDVAPDPPVLRWAARLIAEAVRAARVLERLVDQSSRDPLTGVLNRRGLLETLRREAALAVRHGTALAVLFADLDDFKQINDEHGHSVGDEILRGVVRRLRASLRSSDVIGRLGGDEFVVLLPRTGLRDARLLAGRLSKRIATNPHVTAAGALTVGLTIGAASLDEASAPEMLLETADLRMLAAKRSGRGGDGANEDCGALRPREVR